MVRRRSTVRFRKGARRSEAVSPARWRPGKPGECQIECQDRQINLPPGSDNPAVMNLSRLLLHDRPSLRPGIPGRTAGWSYATEATEGTRARSFLCRFGWHLQLVEGAEREAAAAYLVDQRIVVGAEVAAKSGYRRARRVVQSVGYLLRRQRALRER
jgi:hypothetical protein